MVKNLDLADSQPPTARWKRVPGDFDFVNVQTTLRDRMSAFV